MIHTILFDLDDTLYPRHAGIMGQIRELMLRYIRTRFNLSTAEADDLRQTYLERYGTTMRGLQINHQIEPEEFLAYVHDIPLHLYIQPNASLDAALAALPQDKVVFTNASREHAQRVLAQLGIERHFSRIIDVRDMDFESKPQPGAYQKICALLNVAPEECLLVEDNLRNLAPAKALGMVTVLVGNDGAANTNTAAEADYVIPRIENIGTIPELATGVSPGES